MSKKVNTLFSDDPILQLPTKTIFLAGPTSRENDFSKSWRKDILHVFEQIGFDGTICIPEFRHQRLFEDTDWESQVKWEWQLLDAASCILFWVPRSMPDMPGLTTNLEFGTYLQKKPCQVLLAYPEGAEAMQWMTLRYKEMTAKKPIHNMVMAAVEAADIAKKFERR